MIRWFLLLGMMAVGLYGQTASSSVLYGVSGEEGLHAAFKTHIKLQEHQKNLIGYLEFKENYPISESTYLYVKHALNYFKEKKVAFVIVHINSLGGEILPTIKIVDLFQKFDVNEGIPLMALIDRAAIASSSMLVYACRFIAITPESVMGGSLQPSNERPKVWTVPDTYLPYLLNEYASLASLYGRDPAIAEAMVDPSITVIERDHKLLKVDSLNELNQETANPDVVISPEKDLLRLDAEQLMRYGVADFEVMGTENSSPSKHHKKGTWPFAQSVLSEEPYLGAISEAMVISYRHWTIAVLLFLTHPAVGALLVIGVILSFYIQIKSKKINLAGLMGLIFLGMLMLSSFALQAISWIDLVFLGLGLTLIVLDSTRKVSGGGIIGFLGIGFTIVSLIMLMLPGFEKFTLLDFESSAFVARSLLERVIWLVSALIITWVMLFMIRRKFFPETHVLSRASLMINEAPKERDFLEKFEESVLPEEGSEGIAHCSLRPSGKVMIRDKIYDAVSEDGKMILKKSRVIVVKHHLGKLIVKTRASIDHL